MNGIPPFAKYMKDMAYNLLLAHWYFWDEVQDTIDEAEYQKSQLAATMGVAG